MLLSSVWQQSTLKTKTTLVFLNKGLDKWFKSSLVAEVYVNYSQIKQLNPNVLNFITDMDKTIVQFWVHFNHHSIYPREMKTVFWSGDSEVFVLFYSLTSWPNTLPTVYHYYRLCQLNYVSSLQYYTLQQTCKGKLLQVT